MQVKARHRSRLARTGRAGFHLRAAHAEEDLERLVAQREHVLARAQRGGADRHVRHVRAEHLDKALKEGG